MNKQKRHTHNLHVPIYMYRCTFRGTSRLMVFCGCIFQQVIGTLGCTVHVSFPFISCPGMFPIATTLLLSAEALLCYSAIKVGQPLAVPETLQNFCGMNTYKISAGSYRTCADWNKTGCLPWNICRNKQYWTRDHGLLLQCHHEHEQSWMHKMKDSGGAP